MSGSRSGSLTGTAREPEDKNAEWIQKDITLTRELIKTENVKWRMLDEKTGYIKITEFTGHVDENFSKAINDLNFYMDEGELRVIIGPNGAGKSSMLDLIPGRTKPDKGTIEFGGATDLTALNEYQINRLGIGQQIKEKGCQLPTVQNLRHRLVARAEAPATAAVSKDDNPARVRWETQDAFKCQLFPDDFDVALMSGCHRLLRLFVFVRSY